MEVPKRFSLLMEGLRRAVLMTWAEDYVSAYDLLNQLKEKYHDLFRRATKLREELSRLENEGIAKEGENLLREWGERKALENYGAFKEEVRKRVAEKILAESKRLEGLYTFEDVLATPIVRYFESLKKGISRFADAGLSRYSPRRRKLENCVFAIRSGFLTKKLLEHAKRFFVILPKEQLVE